MQGDGRTVRFVREVDLALAGHEREFAFDLAGVLSAIPSWQPVGGTYGEQICAIRGLADETFVDGQQFVFEMEQLPPGGIGEDFAAGDGQHLAFAFAYFAAVDVGDTEIVAGE